VSSKIWHVDKLPLVRWYIFKRLSQFNMPLEINRLMNRHLTRRMIPEVITTATIFSRPYWSSYKSATAIRAHILEDLLDARYTERTFVSANTSFLRIRRE